MFIGIVLIVTGLVFFARALGFLNAEQIGVLWPLLLIVLGLSFLSHRVFGHDHNGKNCWYCQTVKWNPNPKRKRS